MIKIPFEIWREIAFKRDVTFLLQTGAAVVALRRGVKITMSTYYIIFRF